MIKSYIEYIKNNSSAFDQKKVNLFCFSEDLMVNIDILHIEHLGYNIH